MADNNRNWNNQYQQSNNDWEQNRNRFEDEDRNREDYRYGNAGYGNDFQNKGLRSGYGGAYSSDYGYQGSDNDQTNWGSRGANQNWQNSGNQSQQWRNDERNRRSSDYGQTEWKRRDVDYGNEYSSHRNMGSDYNQGWNQNRNYGNTNDNDRYRNTGYGEGLGMTGGYSNRNYGNRNEYGNNYGNAGYDRDRGWWDRTRDEVSSWFGDDDAERRRKMDRVTGPHKGKGPRDYHRSEDRIREDVCYRLADDDLVDASDIQVQVKDDEVILSGTVNSREEKRRAEDLAESIYGIRNVENRIRVNRNDSDRFDRYTGTTTDAGGVGRESGTTNEIIRNTGNEKNKNK
jgi:osmotically-inducible protein OsmY